VIVIWHSGLWLKFFWQVVDDSIEFKTRIDNVLRETGFAEARPAQMTIDDLLKYVHKPIQ